jgi:hypothetical protein
MSDLRPLLKEDLTEIEARLLRSARLDVPPSSGKGRTIAALGLAAAMSTTAGTGGASTAVAAVGWVAKWLAVGAIGGTMIATVEGLNPLVPDVPRRPSPPAATHAALVASAPRRTAREIPSAPPDPPPVDTVAEPEPKLEIPRTTPPAPTAHETPPASPPAQPTPSALTPERAPAPPPMGTTLADEVNALDEARRALDSGEAESSLRALDAYDLRFGQRRLGPEATLLRIEALLALGRSEGARQLGDRLLAADPSGAYAQRVRSLLTKATP